MLQGTSQPLTTCGQEEISSVHVIVQLSITWGLDLRLKPMILATAPQGQETALDRSSLAIPQLLHACVC